MKTGISIPDSVFREADALSARLGISRSALFTKAVTAFIDRHRDEGITDALNAIYPAEPSSLDPQLTKLGRRSLRKLPW
jgi:antitoxin MazE6